MNSPQNKIGPEKVQCHHCISKVASKKEFPDSIFKSCKHFLKILQLLGIFNFSIYEDFSEFVCRPLRLIYTLLLNALLLALPCGLLHLLASLKEEKVWDIASRIKSTFTSTDCVAIATLLVLLQVHLL